MIEGFELQKVSKSRGLMTYLRSEGYILSFVKGKKGKTSLGSETLARYTLNRRNSLNIAFTHLDQRLFIYQLESQFFIYTFFNKRAILLKNNLHLNAFPEKVFMKLPESLDFVLLEGNKLIRAQACCLVYPKNGE